MDLSILQNRSFQIGAGVALVIVIVIYLISRKGAIGTKLKIDPSGDPLRSGFEPENEAIALYDLFSSWDFLSSDFRKQGMRRILSFNDNELRAVANAYRDKYASEKYNTLRRLVQAEWIIDTAQREIRSAVLDRLSDIGA
jgi:hypothetical protein